LALYPLYGFTANPAFRGRKPAAIGEHVKHTLSVVLSVLALALSVSAQSSQCLIVFSGAKYEYADSYGLTATKPKYSGKELESLKGEGVHVIVLDKKTASTWMESASNSCKSAVAAPAAQAVQAPTVAPVSTAPAAQAVQAPAVAPVSTAPAAQAVQAPAVVPVSTAPAAQAVQAPAATPVSTPVKAKERVCVTLILEKSGKETCLRYAK
jgi:hypothetical protein